MLSSQTSSIWTFINLSHTVPFSATSPSGLQENQLHVGQEYQGSYATCTSMKSPSVKSFTNTSLSGLQDDNQLGQQYQGSYATFPATCTSPSTTSRATFPTTSPSGLQENQWGQQFQGSCATTSMKIPRATTSRSVTFPTTSGLQENQWVQQYQASMKSPSEPVSFRTPVKSSGSYLPNLNHPVDVEFAFTDSPYTSVLCIVSSKSGWDSIQPF